MKIIGKCKHKDCRGNIVWFWEDKEARCLLCERKDERLSYNRCIGNK